LEGVSSAMLLLYRGKMTGEAWLVSTPKTEGVYEMKSPDRSVEVVEIRDLAIDTNLDRPRNFHIIHVNGQDHEDSEYYSLTLFGQCDRYSWRRAGDLPLE
jgi:hypothetical protein